jgi:hypothetical protein
MSPGTRSAAGTIFQAPSRRTEAFNASRDFKAARVACARLSWNNPRAALNTRRPAMIVASTYFPSAISSRIAPSSIHGTGAQNFSSAPRKGCALVSGIPLGPNFSNRRHASSSVKPLWGPTGMGVAGLIEVMSLLRGFALRRRPFLRTIPRARPPSPGPIALLPAPGAIVGVDADQMQGRPRRHYERSERGRE